MYVHKALLIISVVCTNSITTVLAESGTMPGVLMSFSDLAYVKHLIIVPKLPNMY